MEIFTKHVSHLGIFELSARVFTLWKITKKFAKPLWSHRGTYLCVTNQKITCHFCKLRRMFQPWYVNLFMQLQYAFTRFLLFHRIWKLYLLLCVTIRSWIFKNNSIIIIKTLNKVIISKLLETDFCFWLLFCFLMLTFWHL